MGERQDGRGAGKLKHVAPDTGSNELQWLQLQSYFFYLPDTQGWRGWAELVVWVGGKGWVWKLASFHAEFASGSDPIHLVIPGVLRAANLGIFPDIHQVSIFPCFSLGKRFGSVSTCRT